VSSLKCDRWPRPNLERAVRPQSVPPVENWFYKPCGWPLGGRPAACSPTGALWALWAWTGLQWGAGRPTGCSRTTCRKRNRSGIWSWAQYQIQYKALSPLPTHYAYIQTHLPPSGLRNGPTYVALALWLNGPPCKWSGVEMNALVYNVIMTFLLVHLLLISDAVFKKKTSIEMLLSGSNCINY